MTWIAVASGDIRRFAPKGLDCSAADPVPEDAWMAQGSLVVEAQLPPMQVPHHLLRLTRAGPSGIHLSLTALPGGAVVLVVEQGSQMLHLMVDGAETGRLTDVRISYAWDLAARTARLALERPDLDRPQTARGAAPSPLRLRHARTIVQDNDQSRVSGHVTWLAVSSVVEPIGPMPGLSPEAPVRTPDRYVAAGDLRRGDLITATDGETHPILHVLRRTVPALGSLRPLCLKSPSFGLRQDIRVSSSQGLILGGSQVEYLFGSETVEAPASHFLGQAAMPATAPGRVLVDYVQFVLPRPCALDVAGAALKSLNLGRMRRRDCDLNDSLLRNIPRDWLPEHPGANRPCLTPFDAAVLSEYRVA